MIARALLQSFAGGGAGVTDFSTRGGRKQKKKQIKQMLRTRFHVEYAYTCRERKMKDSMQRQRSRAGRNNEQQKQ
jgi:hypothetical protein